jgi:phytoene desaturase
VSRAVVIGSGFGGLAAAIRLQAAGHEVTLIEAGQQVGGRAGQIKDRGFTFDMGPTIITAPNLLEDLWSAAGCDLHADVDLVLLTPYYQIRFRDGTCFDYGPRPPILGGGSKSPRPSGEGWSEGAPPGPRPSGTVPIDDFEAEVLRISPSDLPGYRRFMAATEQIYRRAFEQLGRQPFHSWQQFARVAPELVRLGAHRSVYSFVSTFIQNEHLRCILSFHPLFLGGNPFKASAIYSIVPYLERQGGVWFARGGMHALVEAMARRFASLGGDLRLGTPVTEIAVIGGRAAGVTLTDGTRIPAEIVVSNADVTNTYGKLVPPTYRHRHVGRNLEQFSYSMSCFLLYLGLDRQYPDLRHHTILMPRNYRGVVDAIFGGRLREDDLAIYLHAPTRTDPSMAPPGCESVYALVPVPNLAGTLDWPAAGDRLRDTVIAVLDRELGMTDVAKHIVVEHRYTPLDFRDRLSSFLGAAFSIEPTLLQSAYFRPHNRSSQLPGLYIVGAGTHPGAGLPGALLTAEITANLIAAERPARRLVGAT